MAQTGVHWFRAEAAKDLAKLAAQKPKADKEPKKEALIKRASEEEAAIKLHRQTAAAKVASAKPKKWFKKAALNKLGKKIAS